MEFCKSCRGMMLPRKGADGKVTLVCTKCGATAASPAAKGFALETKRQRDTGIPVIDEERAMASMATIEAACPKCGHDRAMWWLVQTRGVDEPSTRFFRCAKCRHTWREYA